MDFILIISSIAMAYFVIQFLFWSRKEKKREEERKRKEQEKKNDYYSGYHWNNYSGNNYSGNNYSGYQNGNSSITFLKICKLIENDFLSSDKRRSKLQINDLYYLYIFDNQDEVRVYRDYIYTRLNGHYIRIIISNDEYLAFLKIFNIYHIFVK